MYNWSTDVKKIKENKENYAIWKLQQMVNFGLGDKKINLKDLKKYWDKLEMDPHRRKYLELIVYGQRNNYSLSKKGN
jgi:hypothetical protein